MQNALCPICSKMGENRGAVPQISKCTPHHLEEVHHILIEPVSSIFEVIMNLTKVNKHSTGKEPKLTRNQILEFARMIIKPSLKLLKEFLRCKIPT